MRYTLGLFLLLICPSSFAAPQVQALVTWLGTGGQIFLGKDSPFFSCESATQKIPNIRMNVLMRRCTGNLETLGSESQVPHLVEIDFMTASHSPNSFFFDLPLFKGRTWGNMFNTAQLKNKKDPSGIETAGPPECIEQTIQGTGTEPRYLGLCRRRLKKFLNHSYVKMGIYTRISADSFGLVGLSAEALPDDSIAKLAGVLLQFPIEQLKTGEE